METPEQDINRLKQSIAEIIENPTLTIDEQIKTIINLDKNEIERIQREVPESIYSESTKINIAFALSVSKQKITLAKKLLEHGADIENRNDQGQTPLLAAVENHNTDMASWLLERGANINTSDNQGRTPLLAAVENQNTDMVSWLLERGANINTSDKQGRTPLLAAAQESDESGDLTIAQLLLTYGADINIPNQNQETALSIFLSNGKIEIAKEILKHNLSILNIPNQNNITPLMIAAIQADPEIIQIMLAKNANPLMTDHDNRTPLICLLQSLVERSILHKRLSAITSIDHPVSTEQDDSANPFINSQLLSAFQSLLDASQTQINCTTKKKCMSALMFAALLGNLDIMNALLEKDNIDLNQKNELGYTPLMLALLMGNHACAHALLNSGANIDIPANDGTTPLSLAQKMNATDLIQVILKTSQKTQQASQKGSSSCITKKPTATLTSQIPKNKTSLDNKEMKL